MGSNLPLPDQFDAAVLGSALTRSVAESRPGLPVAPDGQAICRDPLADQVVTNSLGAAQRQTQVVFFGAYAARVARNLHIHITPFFQGDDILIEDGVVLRPDDRLVEIKIQAFQHERRAGYGFR